VRPAHLVTLVRQVTEKSRATVVAVHLPGPWSGGDELMVDGSRWRVVRAGSVLAVREALADNEAAGADGRLVLLTPVDEKALGWDVLARVARQRVWMLHAWDLLRDLFRARGVDPRVARLGWLADLLLEHVPGTGFPPAPSGILDLDTAWGHALAVLLGIPTGAPDALILLRWSTQPAVAERWRLLPEEARAGIRDRIGETAGGLGGALAAAIDAGQGPRLVALGLVVDVLWPEAPVEETSVRDAIAAARVRLEPIVGGASLPESVARGWATLALRVLSELPADQAEAQRREAEALLGELRAQAALPLSQVLPAAAARRAEQFARAITGWLAGGGATDPVVTAHAAFSEHVDVQGDEARAERARMALRLVRALSTPAVEEESGFAASVQRHVAHDSWLDTARTALVGGDVEGMLAEAYAALARRSHEWREEASRRFAERLVAWNQHPVAAPEVVPVESALERIVARVADARPVLVVLLDGLDLVVWRRLHSDLVLRGWTWWQPEAATAAPVGIATLPSVTAFSRASLFAGQVKSGHQGTERADFAAHPALRRSSTSNRPPVLFHKGELGAGNGLDPNVRAMIGDRQQRVVGAVVNAVDDWLDRSDQVLPRWSVAAVPLLDALFQEASLAGRAVVVLSDHGHVLDRDTSLRSGGESARWRAAGGSNPEAREVLASGARVRAATGQDSVVLAWAESLRYTGKRTGYHGGASPQEVIAPIAVLSRDDLGIEGWRPVVDAAPAWWEDDAPMPVPTRPTRGRQASPRTVRAAVGTAPSLPDLASTVPSAPAPASPGWIASLLVSSVYAQQRGLAGRTAPRDEQMRAVLETLHRYQGRAPRAAIAAALGVPEIRVRGVLAGVRRVLNVEGFAVLEEEEATGTLMLNRELLRVQFGLVE
jgi:hypothetical protein